MDLTVHLCSNSTRPAWLAGHSQCACPLTGPLALGFPCSLALWQDVHKTDNVDQRQCLWYTQQDPRSITSVLNKLLLVLQKKWGMHYWMIKTHFIRKIHTIHIFYVGFKRVTQHCRRTCKKESNSLIWEASRSLHTDSCSTVKVWWVEMKKWGAQADKKGWNSALIIFPYNFTLFFVFLLQYGNVVDYTRLKFQLYVEFLVMRLWTSHSLRVAHAQSALPLPPNTFSTCPCWSAVCWVLQNNYGKVYACIFKVYVYNPIQSLQRRI